MQYISSTRPTIQLRIWDTKGKNFDPHPQQQRWDFSGRPQNSRRLAVTDVKVFWKNLIKKNIKQSMYGPGQALRFQEAEPPRFKENRHPKEVLPGPRTGRLYTRGNILLVAESTSGP